MSTWLAPYLTQQVTLLRGRLVQDQYGNFRVTWTGATATVVSAYIYVTAGSEETTDQQAEQFDALGFLPASADVANTDRLDDGRHVYEVVGIRDLVHYLPGVAHKQVQLRLITGAGRG